MPGILPKITLMVLNNSFSILKKPFVIGNIAPDAGVPNEDWSEFSPPPYITS